jgi:hypothetical protein
MTIGTHLNIDDQAAVRVLVGPCSVEFHCANTEIEMYDDALAVFIQTGETVLPRLRTRAGQVPAMPYPSHAAVDAQHSSAAGTWVICEAAEPLTHLILSNAVELHWGELTWTITSGALARLLDRARRAQSVLARGEDVNGLLPDKEIPDSEVDHEHATR